MTVLEQVVHLGNRGKRYAKKCWEQIIEDPKTVKNSIKFKFLVDSEKQKDFN